MLKFGFSSQSNSESSITDDEAEELLGFCEYGSSGDLAAVVAESDSDSSRRVAFAPPFGNSFGGSDANVRVETAEAGNRFVVANLGVEARIRHDWIWNDLAFRLELVAAIYEKAARPLMTPTLVIFPGMGRRAMASGFVVCGGQDTNKWLVVGGWRAQQMLRCYCREWKAMCVLRHRGKEGKGELEMHPESVGERSGSSCSSAF